MKRIKLISGLLAGALMLSSVVVPAKVQAKTVDLESGLVTSYSFDDSSLSDSTGAAATAVVTGLGAYEGTLTYESDRNNGKAVHSGDYGLKLNSQNLGENFTVSLWLKPDGAFLKDQSCLFLGYHDPEKWLGVAGNENGTARFWANGNGYTWNSFGTDMAISTTDWHQLTLVGTADGMAAYLDGALWGSASTNSPLVGENQDIYVGVTYWDAEFNGLVDEVKVYNRALSEAEIYRLYDGETAASELLSTTGVTVSPAALNMVPGRTQELAVSLHPVVEAAEPDIAFESSNGEVATVTPDGTVTAVGSGETTITVSVTLDGVTKTAQTAVIVTSSLESHLVASFDFEETLDTATALAKNLNAYSGQIEYVDGHDGRAVRLENYGLQLNTKNIGTDYTITVTQSEGGTISPETAAVAEGSAQTFTITAKRGYQLKDVLVDGQSVGAVATYTFQNVTQEHTITAVFEKEKDDGSHGSHTPSGSASGNKTDTTTNPDGSTTTTVTRPDGSTTATTKAPNGSSSVVNTTKDGQVEATVTVSQGAVKDAEDAVSVPMPALPVTTNQDKAPAVTVNLPTKETVKVEIPVEDATAGTVAILVKADGTEEVLKTSYATEYGVVAALSDGDTVKIVDNSKDFADVPGSFWGADAVDFATSHELFNGTSATSFSPNAAMTRGMIVTVLSRLEGVDTTKGSTWYEAGRQWSMENGISDGTNMEGSLTREQLATMLYRYAGSPAVSGTITGFVDAASVSDWALDAMSWAVENGIITGSNGKLTPPEQRHPRRDCRHAHAVYPADVINAWFLVCPK